MAAALSSPSRATPQFAVERLIGKGSYGKVYRARSLSDGSTVAIKVLPLEDGEEDIAPEIQRELSRCPRLLFTLPGCLNR